VSNDGFRRGQHVTVEIDGEQVDGVFVRQAERQDRINLEAASRGDNSAVGWVRRLDTGEIEAFLYADIEPKPEADVRTAIGKAYKARQEEQRNARVFTEDLRVSVSLSVDLDTAERRPGCHGLSPIKRTTIFIATTVATNLIANLTNDMYAKAKQLLLDRVSKS
jgi:hypothetical protein